MPSDREGSVDPGKYGSARPKLDVDDLDGDVVVLTIDHFEEFEVDERATAVLFFQESGDKALYLNRTMVTTLVDKFGDKSSKWAGKEVPLERRKVTYRGKTFDKVYVMDGDDWDDVLKEHHKASRKRGK